MPPTHITILGGGITGLSSALHLSRRYPSSLITLLEKSPRFGGWIRSERVQVSSPNTSKKIGQHNENETNSASVVLEYGPRTLRPNSKAVLELINLLSLSTSLITIPRSHPSAQNRFLQVSGTQGLTKLPSSLLSFLTSPLLWPVLRELAFRPPNRRIQGVEDDESVHSFLSRRFGETFARRYGSALVHGIYAADSRILSVRAAFPTLWDAESRGFGSVGRGVLFGAFGVGKSSGEERYELGSIEEKMKGVSVYSFRDGMETLVQALVRDLEGMKNVRLVKDVEVTSVRPIEEDKSFEITTCSQPMHRTTHIFSTLPLSTLHHLLPPSSPLPLAHLQANPSSNVRVINLVFPPTDKKILPDGFGYLIPRPEAGYPAAGEGHEGELGMLGVVFDSCSLGAQDYSLPQSSSSSSHSTSPSQFTKLTIMQGGPYPLSPSPTPLASLLRTLSSHLPSLPDPVLVKSHTHMACIPTPTPGHTKRMEELKGALRVWQGGRFEVGGAGVGGVSLGDCVLAGKVAGAAWD
ncbi:hypothetical protein JAAARDRAFT_193052 [Jaapia argillacea MUCL 33604]|uniref:Protoporphyrinogen oxidase n=1 Tax=Jaapia argillacea MUCL 33604 TaxID=933084 RepID=A0A067Q4T1_9AGAM|nr:hypothetical protein JAAARDRAFT_193052 [Jaapia argillacea MUCL 33604]